MEEKRGEETVWDVVILGDGTKADVIEPRSLSQTGEGRNIGSRMLKRSSSFMSTSGEPQNFQAVARSEPPNDEVASQVSIKRRNSGFEEDLRSHLLQQLPSDAQISIDSQTITTKTISVEVSSRSLPVFDPPPGVSVLREEYESDEIDQPTDADKGGSSNDSPSHVPRYKVIYQSVANQFRSTSIGPRNPLDVPSKPEGQHDRSIAMPDEAMSDLDEHRVRSCSSSEPEEPLSPVYDRLDYSETSATNLSPPQRSKGALTMKTKRPSTPECHPDKAANQKRQRKPLTSGAERESDRPNSRLPFAKFTQRSKPSPIQASETKTQLRSCPTKKDAHTKTVGLHQTNNTTLQTPNALGTKHYRPPWRSNSKTESPSAIPVLQKPVNPTYTKKLPKLPQLNNSPSFSSQGPARENTVSRTSPGTRHYSIHERRRNSVVSQTDTYSVHSIDTRPTSPTQVRMDLKTHGSFSRSKSEKDVTRGVDKDETSSVPARRHQRSKSFVPSIHTLQTTSSQTSLVLSGHRWKSIYDDPSAILSLSRDGHFPGCFPRKHFVRNLTRFARFSSASYGANFLRLMGIASATTSSAELDVLHHHEHHSFSSHTGLPPSTILLSSFVDPQGGSNAAGETGTNVPLVHYVSLDHDSQAVVLTCRGTLGFEDVLTDMTCDYDILEWRGKAYQVHKGMHASARRLLQGGGGRVMATIRAALEEFSDYGLVMCGHSLGGGVAALLAILLSEPDLTLSSGASFVTASSPPSSSPTQPHHLPTGPPPASLPPNRPIHVYAYGPPATISPSLRHATRGLITTIVNNQDVVPSLSLGVLHDFQAVALAFKSDSSDHIKSHFRKRVWDGLSSNLSARFGFASTEYNGFFPSSSSSSSFAPNAALEQDPTAPPDQDQDQDQDHWAWASLKALRVSMQNAKLLPPGEVFVVETAPVLQRDAFTDSARMSRAGFGRPAMRVRLKFVRDVEARFGEVRFGAGMLGDHSPGRYEGCLGMLGRGVVE